MVQHIVYACESISEASILSQYKAVYRSQYIHTPGRARAGRDQAEPSRAVASQVEGMFY